MYFFLSIIFLGTIFQLQADSQTLPEEINNRKSPEIPERKLDSVVKNSDDRQEKLTSFNNAYNLYLGLKLQNPTITPEQVLYTINRNKYHYSKEDIALFEKNSVPLLGYLEKYTSNLTQQLLNFQLVLQEFVEKESLNGKSAEEIYEALSGSGNEKISLEEIERIAKECKIKLNSFISNNTIPIDNINHLIQSSKFKSLLTEKYIMLSKQIDNPLEQYKQLERYEQELGLQQFGIKDAASMELEPYIGTMPLELLEFIDQYRRPEKYQKLLKNKQGLLMLGDPGTGKTYTARHIAKNLNAGFIEFNCSQFLDKFMGESEKRADQLVEAAKNYSTIYKRSCVIFLDELDTIGRKRGGNGMEHIHSTLNRLLSLIEQENSNKNIIFIAATNSKINELDSALVRSGRFGKHITFKSPTRDQRSCYLQNILKELAPDYTFNSLTLNKFVSLTDGFSQADLKHTVDNACKKAIHENKKLTELHLLEEIDKRQRIKQQQRKPKTVPS